MCAVFILYFLNLWFVSFLNFIEEFLFTGKFFFFRKCRLGQKNQMVFLSSQVDSYCVKSTYRYAVEKTTVCSVQQKSALGIF
jgi:hypothetical protein